MIGFLILVMHILYAPSPVYADNETWINPYTNVTWDGVYSFFSAPVKVWDGSDLVDYVIRRNNETSILLKTPRCSYMIGTDLVNLFKPNGTTSVGSFSWILEKQDSVSKTWTSLENASTSVGYNYTHVWETWTFKDGSERILAISKDNKQTVSFTPSENGSYRVVWDFSSLQATKSRLGASISQIKGEKQLLNFEDTSIEFHDEKERIVRIEWSDIDKSLYRDLRYDTSSCLLTYGNVDLDVGEVWTVDPTTFTSEASLDGYMETKGVSFPPPEDTATVKDTALSYACIGKKFFEGWYYIRRAFTSFNTSMIDDDATIDTVKLCMTGKAVGSGVDFDVGLYSGFYGDALDDSDWNACPTYRAIISKSCFDRSNYFEIALDPDVVNKTGRTQFRYIATDELTAPEFIVSDIWFYTGDHSTKYPTLIVDLWTEEEQEEEQYVIGSEGTSPLDEIAQIIPAPPKISISTLGLWIVVGGVAFIGVTAVSRKLQRSSKRKPRGVRRSPRKTQSFKPRRSKRGRFK
ncbi:hypothetical protein ES702_06788 [subsurface metagenome]